MPIVNYRWCFYRPAIAGATAREYSKANLALVNTVARLPLAAIDIDGGSKHENTHPRRYMVSAATGQRLADSCNTFNLARKLIQPNFRLISVADLIATAKLIWRFKRI
jgi:hypothetical protein